MAAPTQTLQVVHIQCTTTLFDRLYMVDHGGSRCPALPRTFLAQGVAGQLGRA